MILRLKIRLHLVFVNFMQLEDENSYVNAYMRSTNHEEHMECIKTLFGEDIMKTRFHVNPAGLWFFCMHGFIMVRKCQEKILNWFGAHLDLENGKIVKNWLLETKTHFFQLFGPLILNVSSYMGSTMHKDQAHVVRNVFW